MHWFESFSLLVPFNAVATLWLLVARLPHIMLLIFTFMDAFEIISLCFVLLLWASNCSHRI